MSFCGVNLRVHFLCAIFCLLRILLSFHVFCTHIDPFPMMISDLPTAATWVKKYGEKPIVYDKDLKVAYNSVTQLGAEFTGGKYESLLKNKKRKTLNDDELDFLR